jgi:antitoxin PrlF
MKKPEITSLSSRGQIVIPQQIRDSLKLKEGEKFMVMEEGGIIILRKLELPSFRNIQEVIKKTKGEDKE